MSINLLEKIQQNLNYPPLHKINPNTEDIKETPKHPVAHTFSQAAIPAVLTALYKYVQSDMGAEEFLRGDTSTNWVSKIFPDNKKQVVETIVSYAQQIPGDPLEMMNDIADETVRVVKENLHANPSVKDVKVFFSNQRNNMLLYLPGTLHMGDLLHDTTLDDTTNKMEGPISSLMHSIGSAFSNPVTEDEIKKH